MKDPFSLAQKYLDPPANNPVLTPEDKKAANAGVVIKEALTQETTPEALAASILAENTQAEAAQILAFWKRAFGVDLERVRERSAEVGVQEHLRRLREWQRRFGG